MSNVIVGSLSVQIPDAYRPALIVFSAPSSGTGAAVGTNKSLTVASTLVPKGTTVEQFRSQQLQALSQQLPGMQTVKVSTVTVGGRTWPLLEIHCTSPQGGLPLSNLVAFVVEGDEGITLSASALRGEAFDSTRAEFLRAFESLEIARR